MVLSGQYGKVFSEAERTLLPYLLITNQKVKYFKS